MKKQSYAADPASENWDKIYLLARAQHGDSVAQTHRKSISQCAFKRHLTHIYKILCSLAGVRSSTSAKRIAL